MDIHHQCPAIRDESFSQCNGGVSPASHTKVIVTTQHPPEWLGDASQCNNEKGAIVLLLVEIAVRGSQ